MGIESHSGCLIRLLRSYPAASLLGALPTVSVLISARNEEKDIDWKVAETLAWDYPNERLELLVASDDSTDGTDEILRNSSSMRTGRRAVETIFACVASGRVSQTGTANGCRRRAARTHDIVASSCSSYSLTSGKL